MSQGLLSKLIWGGLIVFILFGVIYAEDKSKTAFLEPWIYQAMDYLYQKGLMPDYPADWVNSGNQLSRFEVAYYIKQLITSNFQSDLSNPVVERIQKLIAEFRTELTDLGIKITDIYQISPKLGDLVRTTEYQDLDLIVSAKSEEKPEPFYYYGQYFSELQRKSFIFIPSDYVEAGYISLLEGNKANINIVYQPRLEDNPSFLVVKGNLPVYDSKQLLIKGYYLFPLEDNDSILMNSGEFLDTKINESVLSLLDEVNGLSQVDNLWKFNGVLPLESYLRLETDFQAKPLAGTLDQGLKIGSFLINTENPSTKNQFEVNNFGLPFYNPRQISPSTPMDLDAINGKNLQSVQINLSGSLSLDSQMSLYGGLDFLYRGTNTGLDSLWPSDTKASAGVNYHFSDYWTVLIYRSFVNSQLKTGLLSTTSIGVDYNDWVTLWLAYQLLNFDDPVVSGTLSIRF